MVPRDIDRYSTTIYLCIPRDVVPGDAGAGVIAAVIVCGGLYLFGFSQHCGIHSKSERACGTAFSVKIFFGKGA